jgi:very-short-patch-repair endonuclease
MRAPPRTRIRAKQLRSRLTPPEARLWTALSRGRLEGLHFRKQHPVGPYILDFYCADARLAVEVDGAGHGYGDRPGHDERRDAWLSARGIRTLRVPASRVKDELDAVLGLIRAAAIDGELPS